MNVQTPQPMNVGTYAPREQRYTNTGRIFPNVALAIGQVLQVLSIEDFGEKTQGQVTLTLGRSGPVNLADPATTDVRAQIHYGAGGGGGVIECDWANGVCVTLGATKLEVTATGVAALGAGAYSPAPTTLSVTLAQYPRAGGLAPKHTTAALLGPAGTIDVVAPPFASAVRLLAANAAGGSGYGGDLRLQQLAGSALVYDRFVTNPDPVAVLSVRPCVLRVTNGSGVATYAVHVQFDLAL